MVDFTGLRFLYFGSRTSQEKVILLLVGFNFDEPESNSG
jgi:hypothetical protein